MHHVDITFSTHATLADGTTARGTVTARVDVSRQPWPDQKWEGSLPGDNPLGPGDTLEVDQVLSTALVPASECSKDLQ